MSKTPFDPYQTITDRIVAALEAGTPPWRKPWTGDAPGCALPLRHNGEAYRGINTLILWLTAMEKEYRAAHWMTFRQAKELGGYVRKGEKGTLVVYYGQIERENAEKPDADPDRIPFLRSYSVFNADQIDGLPEAFLAPETKAAEDTGSRAIEDYEERFARFGVAIETVEGRGAFYRPDKDLITMPPVERFRDARSYYATLAHECVHATGHASRLDRFSEDRTREAYAFEELIAEIGACYFGAMIGLEPAIEESAAYVESWLKALRNDKRMIFKAASAAQRASDYLVDATEDTSTTKADAPRRDPRTPLSGDGPGIAETGNATSKTQPPRTEDKQCMMKPTIRTPCLSHPDR